MREVPKPHELLSSKEKEAFVLCKEILLWASDKETLSWPGVLELKKNAKKLYSLVSKMDMEHDDRYYVVHAQIDRLRARWQELKRLMDDVEQRQEKTIVHADIEHGDIEALVNDIETLREQGKKYIYVRQENGPGVSHMDCVEVQILGYDAEDKWNVRISEMFGYFGDKPAQPYTEPIRQLVVRPGKTVEDFLRVYRKRYKRGAEAEDGPYYDPFDDPYAPYRHEEGDVQYATEVFELTWQEAKEFVRSIFESIKAHPRKDLE